MYRRRADTWTQTNVTNHIATVRNGGRLLEARILKLWRNKNNLDFPSFYLELATISALRGSRGTLSENVWKAFEYFRADFAQARIVDPANTNNVISDDLSATAKAAVARTAARAVQASDWNQIVT